MTKEQTVIVAKLDETNRPNCPNCKSGNVIANIKEFFCRRCGNRWSRKEAAKA